MHLHYHVQRSSGLGPLPEVYGSEQVAPATTFGLRAENAMSEPHAGPGMDFFAELMRRQMDRAAIIAGAATRLP